MNDYEINCETLALIDHKNKTIVYEKNNTFSVNKKPNEIMEESCEYFGSSLIGRQKGTTKLIGITHKAPVIVEEENELIFFPTSSPRLKDCSWISVKNIKNYYRNNNKTVTIEYNDGNKILLNISYGIIDNQILRSARLETMLRNRKNNIKKM